MEPELEKVEKTERGREVIGDGKDGGWMVESVPVWINGRNGNGGRRDVTKKQLWPMISYEFYGELLFLISVKDVGS